ncbi:MAG: cobyric acid synthase [Rhodospirillaceae bacterium]|jgi:adenosylcobyric acid synthase|nr:cobyric acid synthase [Rhodospirillales bacterium]MBT3907148.1 cobyric acid synthase [Rhodospirillaceae bacterium]MBT4700231.1 cobyric acid synthase [Rhodospirillaceae bacterium]MBT5032934.1 cobyric acid synthase [Rhodospirillaceae bacterium]MBT6219797.1 cobyric acid synthase [Rhodospirillaceae bacterium]
MTAKALMFQGTGSDVGKSLMVAGLARALVRRGLKVLPFKPQNMSNNAAVTKEGGEIGRAQALQAQAAKVDATVDMNPVLLKPQSDVGAQVVVRGKVRGNAKARDYQKLKPDLLPEVMESFERLKEDADIVLIEGAGSASEINLRDGDIANMGFATAADVPVVLVADIDRGGVIGSLVGTWHVVTDAEKKLIAGYIINKFRGDQSLFDDGIKIIEEQTSLSCFGVVPYLPIVAQLPAEDSMALEQTRPDGIDGTVKITVPRLAHISNFDDFDPLIAEPSVQLDFIPPGQALPGDADLVILPGSKATIADLTDFQVHGWDLDLKTHIRRGGSVLGICGGYQMLGTHLFDPEGIEGASNDVPGLGYLELQTILTSDKSLSEVSGTAFASLGKVRGYEMHSGQTMGSAINQPFATLEGHADGAVSEDGKIMGCYIHGLFAEDEFRSAFLNRLRPGSGSGLNYEAEVERALESLADSLENALDIDALIKAAR